jgi:DNA-binding Lrp family transcriptional regulator
MITAFVMMHAQRERIAQIPDELLKIAGVTEVYSVAGDYDLIALVRVKEAEELTKVVTENFAKVQGITNTKTQIAFACFSNYDLDHIFSVGMSDNRK